MLWQIKSFPRCRYHVFLSHCREDREWLVHPVEKALRTLALIPWIDCHDYPYGRRSFAALRDGVLQCRHVVFLVTDGMLKQARGWGLVELAWADVLQENLQEPGGSLQNVMLPLFFLSQEDARLPRSVWCSIRDRAAFHRPEDGDAVSWAVSQITNFLRRESQRAEENEIFLRQDSRLLARLAKRPGFIDRILHRYPT